jgi:hypothetical protein
MFATVVTPDHSRTRQNRWASLNALHFDSTTLPNNHFYSPNDSDEDSTGGGFLPDQTHFTDQSLPFPALQQISNLSPVSDRPHLPSDDSWLATASDEHIEDTPYIPPTDQPTHYSSNITLPNPLRPPLDTPRDSRDIYTDSHFYDVCLLRSFISLCEWLTFTYSNLKTLVLLTAHRHRSTVIAVRVEEAPPLMGAEIRALIRVARAKIKLPDPPMSHPLPTPNH